MRLILCFIFLIASCLGTGCRFKFPSSAEGRHLVEKEAFAGSVPVWVNQNKEERVSFARSSGIVPQSYASPSAMQVSRSQTGAVLDTTASAVERQQSAIPDVDDESAQLTDDELSPFDRIESLCPGLEGSVSEALRTELEQERIAKYERLTQRCPNSADLWLWLGKDYQSSGRMVEANRAFENVLVYDPGNEAARALLSVVRRSLNQESTN